jgi:hypothetical protein
MRRLKYTNLLGLLLTSFLVQPNVVSAQTNSTCISLKNSKTCPDFSSASVSTSLTADFPFLEFISTVEQFDTQFTTYIQQQYSMYVFYCHGSNSIGKSMRKRCSVQGLIYLIHLICTHNLHEQCYVRKWFKSQLNHVN